MYGNLRIENIANLIIIEFLNFQLKSANLRFFIKYFYYIFSINQYFSTLIQFENVLIRVTADVIADVICRSNLQLG